MRVVVTTYDRYTFLMPIFRHFYTKQWPDNPYKTMYTNGKLPWWDGVVDFIGGLKDRVVLLLMDDYILTKPVDTGLVRAAERICSNGVGCVRLVDKKPPQLQYCQECEFDGFSEYPTDKPYSISMQAAFWNRKYLLGIMNKHKNAWQFETEGSKIASDYDKRVIVTNKPIMNYHPSGYMQKGRVVKSVESWVKENW